MSQVSHSSGHGRGFTFAAVIGAAIIFFVVFFFAELFYTVNASMVGVVLSGGKISSVSQPGMHSKVPFYQQVKFIDLKSNSGSVKTEAYTFDQQNATLKINVIWNFVGTKAEDIYVNYKGDEKYIYEYVIAPKLIDCAKTIFGQYNAEKVIQKRAEFVNLLNTQFKELMTDIPVQIRSVQVEETLQPLRRNLGTELDRQLPRIADQSRQVQPVLKKVIPLLLLHQVHFVQTAGHHFCHMLYIVASPGQKVVEGRIQQRVDFERSRRSESRIDRFAVSDLFLNRNRGRSDLFHRVGPVGIIAGIADQPAVIQFDLVGRPGIQGELLHIFDVLV